MKLGIIGAGNMGSSILKGVTSSNFLENKNIAIFDLNKEKIEELSKEYGVKKAENENELAKESDILILSVKPNIVPKVLDKIKDDLSEKTIVLSIAAGISIDFIENIIGTDKKVIRTMPNTPAQVMEGMTALKLRKNLCMPIQELVALCQHMSTYLWRLLRMAGYWKECQETRYMRLSLKQFWVQLKCCLKQKNIQEF